jgi:uncharacterized protein with NRDE domain
MCLIVLNINRTSDWPVVIAANRDEYYERQTTPPRLLNQVPQILAGQDVRAGGTWLGVNENGLIAALTNCYSEPEQVPGHTSRGKLCLQALHCTSTGAAIERVAALVHEQTYNPFNILLIDNTSCWIGSNMPDWQCRPLADRWHVLGNSFLDDPADKRVVRAHAIIDSNPNLRDPQPGPTLVKDLEELCRDHGDPQHTGTTDTLCMHGDLTGTRSSTVLCLNHNRRVVVYRHTDVPPCQADYYDVLVPWQA